MTPEELDLIKKRLTIFLLMKSELRRDYERLKRASAGGDAEAEELANKILQATKPWST
jgi:cell division septum initiation protein DivIVA